MPFIKKREKAQTMSKLDRHNNLKPFKCLAISEFAYLAHHEKRRGPLRVVLETGAILTITRTKKLIEWLQNAVLVMENQKKGEVKSDTVMVCGMRCIKDEPEVLRE